MRITVAIGLGLALAANGLLMLFDPAGCVILVVEDYVGVPLTDGDARLQPSVTERIAAPELPCPG